MPQFVACLCGGCGTGPIAESLWVYFTAITLCSYNEPDVLGVPKLPGNMNWCWPKGRQGDNCGIGSSK